MFFHADELRKFWESENNGAESETDSILAADEEGLGHLNVQVMQLLHLMYNSCLHFLLSGHACRVLWSLLSMVRDCMNALCLQMMKVCIHISFALCRTLLHGRGSGCPLCASRMPWPVKPESDVPARKVMQQPSLAV